MKSPLAISINGSIVTFYLLKQETIVVHLLTQKKQLCVRIFFQANNRFAKPVWEMSLLVDFAKLH